METHIKKHWASLIGTSKETSAPVTPAKRSRGPILKYTKKKERKHQEKEKKFFFFMSI